MGRTILEGPMHPEGQVHTREGGMMELTIWEAVVMGIALAVMFMLFIGGGD
jgi:hypothetical protein